MRATESQQAAEVAVEVLIGELRTIKDDPTAEAHALHVGVPLLAELDPASRAVWSSELKKAVPGLGAEELHTELTAWNQRHGNGPGRTIELVSAATITPKRTDYVWDARVVAADFGLLVGPPGVGKGAIMMHVTARLTRGDLDGDLHGSPAAVVIASAEDSPAHAIVPRLQVAGADMSKVFIVRVTHDGTEDGLTLPDDVPDLVAHIELVSAALVIIDPITAHLSGKVDSHKDASLRRALAPLARMAHETGAAVVGVAHLNKAAGGDWVRRVGGSVGLGAAARNVLIAADDPDGDDRIIVHAKSNTGALAPALRYRIEGREIEHGGETISTCSVAWLGEADGVTAADVLAEREPEERTERDEAAEWLTDHLEDHDGEARTGDIFKAATRDGIAKRTLQRARKQAGVITHKRGRGGWVWELAQGAKLSRHVARGALAPCSSCDEPSGTLAPSDETHDYTQLKASKDSQYTQGATCQDTAPLAPCSKTDWGGDV